MFFAGDDIVFSGLSHAFLILLRFFSCRGFTVNEHVHLRCGHTYHDHCIKLHIEEQGPKCAVDACLQPIHPIWLRAKGYAQGLLDAGWAYITDVWRQQYEDCMGCPSIGKQGRADLTMLIPPYLMYPDVLEGTWSLASLWMRVKEQWGDPQEARQVLENEILAPRSWDNFPQATPVQPRRVSAYIGSMQWSTPPQKTCLCLW